MSDFGHLSSLTQLASIMSPVRRHKAGAKNVFSITLQKPISLRILSSCAPTTKPFSMELVHFEFDELWRAEVGSTPRRFKVVYSKQFQKVYTSENISTADFSRYLEDAVKEVGQTLRY